MVEKTSDSHGKAGGLKIRTKLFLALIVLVFVVSLNNILITWISANKTLTSELLERVVANTRSVVDALTNFVLVGDKEGIINLIFTEKSSRKDLAYLMVFDENNKIIASTLTQENPDFLIGKNSLSSDKSENINLITNENGEKIYDIAVRLNYNKGVLRSGYFEKQISAAIRKIIFLMFFSLAVSILIAIIFSFFLAKIFLKQLESLKNTAIKVAQGDLRQRASVDSEDEIGFLAVSFNQMLDKIEKTQDDLKKAGVQLEQKVEERTKEIQTKLEEMERFHDLTVGREMKMIELKKKIEELEKK